MRRLRQNILGWVAGAGILLVSVGCPEQSLETRVLQARAGYSLTLEEILIEDPEGWAGQESAGEETSSEETVAEAAVAVEAAMVAEEAAEGEGFEEEQEEPINEQGPRTVTVLLDLVVRFTGPGEALPGITAEILHTDPFQQEKARHQTWIETGGLREGEERQVPVSLEVDNYEDGDSFAVEVRQIVPPEERSGYREFAEAGE